MLSDSTGKLRKRHRQLCTTRALSIVWPLVIAPLSPAFAGSPIDPGDIPAPVQVLAVVPWQVTPDNPDYTDPNGWSAHYNAADGTTSIFDPNGNLVQTIPPNSTNVQLPPASGWGPGTSTFTPPPTQQTLQYAPYATPDSQSSTTAVQTDAHGQVVSPSGH